MRLPNVLEEQGQGGAGNGEVGQRRPAFKWKGIPGGHWLGEASHDPRAQGDAGKLPHGEHVDVSPFGEVRYQHDVQRIEERAAKRHGVAEADGQVSTEADEANACNAQHGCHDVVAVGAAPKQYPCQEGDDHAIRTSEERVFAGRRVGDANCLQVVSQEHGKSEQQAVADMRPFGVGFAPFQERDGHDDGRCREPHGENPGGRDDVRDVFHDDERAAPDNGGQYDEHPIPHAAYFT